MKARFLAFAIHFAGSVTMGLLAIALVFFVWYPGPLATGTGVTTIFFLVLAVDVILGPALTFVVYKKGKKSLRFDLACILILQLAAFGYGIWTVSSGRPLWLVFSVDRFKIVLDSETDDRYLSKAKPEYQHAPWFGPRWVSTHDPEDERQRKQLALEVSSGGLGFARRPDLYQPLALASAQIQLKALPLDDLKHFNPTANVDGVLARWPTSDAWLPMKSVPEPMVVLLRKETAEVVAVVDLRPSK